MLLAMLAFATLLALALARADKTPIAGTAPSEAAQEQAKSAYEKLPLSFVSNAGQTDSRVHYYAQSSNYGFYFTSKSAVLSLRRDNLQAALNLRFLGAAPGAKLEAMRQAEGKVNYIEGKDPSGWHTGLSTYGEVAYRGLWPGIDMSFRGNGGKLEYEFLVKPGARTSDIRLAYGGAQGISMGKTGELRIDTPLGTLTDNRPRSYQVIGGRKVTVDSRFSLGDKAGTRNEYGFRLGPYDHRYPLIIDPGLAYSTYLGGSDDDFLQSIETDAEGNAYLAGATRSDDFPITPNAPDKTLGAGLDYDVFIAKLNADGSGLVYSTFVGGPYGDEALDLAVDGEGSAYITGEMSDADYPTTPGAYDTTYNGGADVIVTKLDPTGSSLVYSTLIGASSADVAYGIDVDSQGNAYVSGVTLNADYPVTVGAYDTTFNSGTNGSRDAFVTKVNPTGSALSYSTFLGGISDDEGYSIGVDDSGSAYVTGLTNSVDMPTTMGAYDKTFGSPQDAFVSKLSPGGSNLAYSTYLGGNDYDYARALAIDGQGAVYVAGHTNSANYPTTPGAFDTSFNGNDLGDAVVTKLNQTGSSLVYSTFLGGTVYDNAFGIAVDDLSNAYVVGFTSSGDFPTTSNAYDTAKGSRFDGFVSKLNSAGSGLDYSTYLGGSTSGIGGDGNDEVDDVVVDDAGDVYVAGQTYTSDFPTTAGAFDTTYGGILDSFVAKLQMGSLYETPQSAPSLQASIVPAFRPCGTSGNPVRAKHSPPLAVGSCNPPRPGGVARIGPQSTMSAVLTAVPGDHVTSNGDQADFTLNVAMSDVITDTGLDFAPNPTGPDMTLYARIRFTDVNNGPSGGDPGTAGDFDFALPVECAPTPNPGVGSSCSANTSADGVTPGLIKEDRSTVLQTFRLRVNDSGLDGIRGNSDDAVFATQGVFVP
jgi:hypothetical protein